MAEQVKCIEMLRLDGESLRPAEQVQGDEITRVVDQLLLGQPVDQSDNGRSADEGEENPADAFDQRMGALNQDADLKDLVDSPFLRLSLQIPRSACPHHRSNAKIFFQSFFISITVH